MKRKLITAAIIVVCFLLQTTVFKHLSFSGIEPNLMIIVTATFGFMRGQKSGAIIGFICGFLMDFISGGAVGINMISFTVIGYINGFFMPIFYDDDITLPLGLISASDLVYGVIIYLLVFMLKGDFNFIFYLLHIIIPEVIYTLLVTLILYKIILYFNSRLNVEEQRSASKFV